MKRIPPFHRYFLLLVSCVIILGMSAQHTHKNPEYISNTVSIASKDTAIKPPVLKLTGDRKKEEKEPTLQTLSIAVKVVGRMAVTTMDMTFYNENNRVLEGELQFPLGEGQTVSRFALDVNGEMREAVVVDKNKGQQVYEEIIRTKSDPGLLEHIQGNSYRVRVYPLPAKGTKRLIIAYEQELPVSGNDPLYYLPLNYGMVIRDFSLHIEVAQQLVKKNSDGILLEYKLSDNNTVADLKEKNFNAVSFLAFAIQEAKTIQPFCETIEGINYFYAPLQLKDEKRVKPIPSSIALFWDASGSGATRNLEKELRLLKSYLSKGASVKLTVITFAHKILEEKEFQITPSNFSVLENYLKQIKYDGATQFNCLAFNNYKADEIIVCSDGLSDYGKVELQEFHVPIFTIASSQKSDFDLLRYIAKQSGGEFVNLNVLAAEEALHLITHESLRVLEIKTEQPESNISPNEIYPTIGTTITKAFAITGKTAGTNTSITVVYGYGNTKSGEQKINLRPGKETDHNGVIKRLWAQKKLQELLLQPSENKEIIVQCAVDHGIVTPFTSLLVLDRLEDYLRYEIAPPAPLKKAFDSAQLVTKNASLRTKSEQLTRVVSMMQERIKWWNHDYTTVQKKIRIADSIVVVQHNEQSSRQVAVRRSAAARNNLTGSVAGASSLNQRDDNFEVSSNGAAAAESRSMNEDAMPSFLGSRGNTLQKAMAAEPNRIKASLTNWDPNAPYMKSMKASTVSNAYDTYLKEKKDYVSSTSFYLDMADYFFKLNQKEDAIRIVSNLAEIDVQNYRLLRVLAHRLEQAGLYNDAIALYRQVLVMRKEEPQSFRDLGLALAKNNRKQEAIETLYEAVTNNYDGRFPEIELIVLGEINQIISGSTQKLNTEFMDSRLIASMPLDARVILNWDADDCDIDLWVTDPTGEKCFYSNRNTRIGGHNSADFTGGYGPEEFILKNAMKGKYKVEINYYGTSAQTILGPTTIQVEIYTQYGKPEVKVIAVTRRLESQKQTIEIGSFEVQ